MKTYFLCPTCLELEENGISLQQGDERFINIANLNEDGIYYIKCKFGHETYYLDQSLKFEKLFRSGCYALLDGYHREAVTSFAASLERFYESVLLTILSKTIASTEIQVAAWKHIKKQSERQLGAFIYLFLKEYSKLPLVLDEKDVGFRNKVIHMGTIPTYEEALRFGQTVLNIQRINLADLFENDEGHWYREFGKERMELEKKIPQGYRISIVSNIFSFLNPLLKDSIRKEIDLKSKLEKAGVFSGTIDGTPYRLAQFLM